MLRETVVPKFSGSWTASRGAEKPEVLMSLCEDRGADVEEHVQKVDHVPITEYVCFDSCKHVCWARFSSLETDVIASERLTFTSTEGGEGRGNSVRR